MSLFSSIFSIATPIVDFREKKFPLINASVSATQLDIYTNSSDYGTLVAIKSFSKNIFFIFFA